MYRENHDEVRTRLNLCTQAYDIFVFRFKEGKRYQVTNMEVDEVRPGLANYESQIALSENDAQKLFDDLWDSGLRPKRPDEYAAKDEHLADLRKITFHALGISSNSNSSSNSSRR